MASSNNGSAMSSTGSSGDGGAGVVLLSQPEERLQTCRIGDTLVVLSTEDILEVGAGTAIGDQLRVAKRVCLYAEDILVSASLRLPSSVIGAHAISQVGDGLLDLAGTDGSAPDLSDPNAPPENGGNGGDLQLYLEELAAAGFVAIDARGGRGGPGRQGTASQDGGPGGSGGDGGDVSVLAGSADLRAIAALKAIDADNTLDPMKAAVKQLAADQPDTKGMAALEKAASRATSLEQLREAIDAAGLEFSASSEISRERFEAAISVTRGSYGEGGSGKKRGGHGEVGADGTRNVRLFGSPAELARLPAGAVFVWAHPSQCEMALEKAKLSYLVADPVTAPQRVTDTAALLARLRDRTAPFTAAASDSPLAQMLADSERAIGAVDSLETFGAVHTEATELLDQIGRGADVFGYGADHVPLVALDAYRAGLRQLIENLDSIEQAYHESYAQLRAGHETTGAIAAARNRSAAVIAEASSRREELVALAGRTAGVIDAYQETLAGKKQAVVNLIGTYEGEIRQYESFSLKDILDALGMVAFAPESGLMWIVAGAQVLNGRLSTIGDETIDSDQGNPIRKSYVIEQLDQVKATMASLVEGYQTTDLGQLAPDDPGAAKLLVVRDQLEALLQKFWARFPTTAKELQAAFEAYVNTVAARNTQIVVYNAIIRLALKQDRLVQRQQLAQRQLDDAALSTMTHVWPALTAYVSRLYYQARQQVLELMDLTSRAFRFWALSDRDLFAEALGGREPPKIDVTAIRAMESQIAASALRQLEDFGQDSTPFKGLTHELSDQQVAQLRDQGAVMFALEPNGEPGTFAGLVNVRLTDVRVWIDGAATGDGYLQLRVTHTGDERIVDQTGVVYSFRHEPRVCPFRYRLADREVMVAARLGIGDDGSGKGATWALVGPFTWWEIAIPAKDNKSLDLSQVKSVTLELAGTAYAPDSSDSAC